MKKILLMFLASLFLFNQAAYAAGNSFWKKKETFEKKVYRVGKDILKKNYIHKHIVFNVSHNRSIVNAYANMSDINVCITKGLLYYIETDDELAAVLSHEIAHILNKHYKRNTAKIVVIYPLLIAFAPLGVAIYGNWTKKDEYEADLSGVELMANAGYDPNAMLIIFNKIMSNPNKIDFGSHPPTIDRIVTVNNFIKKNYPQYKNSKYRKQFEEECVFADYEYEKNISNISPAPLGNYRMYMVPAEDL